MEVSKEISMIRIRSNHPNAQKIFVDALKKNEVVAYPTDTIYGIGTNAENIIGINKINKIKKRSQPMSVIIHDFNVVKNKLILEQNISKSISKEYLSIGLPQLSIDGGLNYNYEVQKSLIDISNFMPGVPKGTEQEVQFGQTYDGRVDFNVNQMIFNGSYFVGLAATKELEKLSNKLTRRTEIDIYESVSKKPYFRSHNYLWWSPCYSICWT